MADSRVYRQKFLLTNLVFLGLCVLILIFVYALSDTLSGGKIDMTQEGVYTISEPTETIVSELTDTAFIDYYVSDSDKMPSSLQTVVRDTRDMFEEFRELSDGRFEYRIIDPDKEADLYAEENVEKYDAAKQRGETPKEPVPAPTMQQLFSRAPAATPEQILENRNKTASAMAAQQGRQVEDVFRQLLADEYKDEYQRKLETEQRIVPYPVREMEAGSVRTVEVYSAINVRYLGKNDAVPFHYSIESLEYELASRLLKLATENKSVVAVFDPRKPAAPPFNPMSPQQQPPTSEYAGIWSALGDLFDIREIDLKEDDSLEGLAEKVKEERWEAANEDLADDEAAKEKALAGGVKPGEFKSLISTLVIVQPDQLQARQVYEINRAVSLGVKTIILASGFSMDVSQEGLSQGIPIVTLSPGTDFDDMIDKWGLELRRELLASNDCGNIGVPQQNGPFRYTAPYPVAAAVVASRDGLSDTNPLTNGISELVFPSTVGVTVSTAGVEKAGLEHEVLAKTGDRTWSVAIDPFANMNNPMARGRPVNLFDKKTDLIDRKDEDFSTFVSEPVALAVLMQGKFPFQYQGQPVPEWEAEPETPPNPHGGMPGMPGMPGGMPFPGSRDEVLNAVDPEAIALGQEEGSSQPSEAIPAPPAPAVPAPPVASEASAAAASGAGDNAAEPEAEPAPPVIASVEPTDGRLLFIPSADMMKTDYLSQQGYQNNVNFFYNVVETFGLDDKLLKIRRKQLTARQFKPGSDEDYKYIIVLNLVVVPLAVAAIGTVLFLIRRSQSVRYERNYIARQR